MNKKLILTIELIIMILTLLLLIGKAMNKEEQVVETNIDNKVQYELSETTTTTTTTKQTTKKTTKKTTKRKVVKNTSFNIKASVSEMKEYAKNKVIARWNEGEWKAFENIVQRESGWNANSINKSSGACGLFQMYPCSKTNAAYKTSYEAQVDAGINYIASRYKTPNKAWNFWKTHHWY